MLPPLILEPAEFGVLEFNVHGVELSCFLRNLALLALPFELMGFPQEFLLLLCLVKEPSGDAESLFTIGLDVLLVFLLVKLSLLAGFVEFCFLKLKL